MKRFVCLHGHFYQPPRENAWLERVDRQASAAPFHDWNERVSAECYAPNAFARILSSGEAIRQIVNNYASMSFNFGPTLLSWMEREASSVYRAVLEADRLSLERYDGHGNAIAQAYGHLILPLADARDKQTQVLWGLRDFESRFGRKAEGMWLPEAAVDTETLETLASAGVRFTVLAPRQAAAVRAPKGDWEDVSGGRVDPRRAYRACLPSGKRLALFFYDGPVSQGIAFEGLLKNGDVFFERLTGLLEESPRSAQLAHIATDGETYGHHHRFGEMALAYVLERLELEPSLALTNYGQFLKKSPPRYEARIVENSSWSCAHGVERWRADCGCASGGNPDWNQKWREPLRESLDWLRDRARDLFERDVGKLLADPWEARNAYIQVVLDRSEASVTEFLGANAVGNLSDAGRTRILSWMELQRHAMAMYTSCGWFFDDIDGIENAQILQYAGRVVELARELAGEDLEPEFLKRLSRARSNKESSRTGADIFKREMGARRLDLLRIGAAYGIQALERSLDESIEVCGHRLEQKDLRVLRADPAQLTVGQVAVSSLLTGQATSVNFAFFDPGDGKLEGGARHFEGRKEYEHSTWKVTNFFFRKEFDAVRAALREVFPDASLPLKSLKEVFENSEPRAGRDEVAERVKRLLADPKTDGEGLRHFLESGENLWRAQNIYYQLMRDALPGKRRSAESGDAAAGHWVERFESLAPILSITLQEEPSAS